MKPNAKLMDEYINKVQEMRSKKANDEAKSFNERLAKTRAQSYSAARQGKIYPRATQFSEDENYWEDAKVYDKNTRQGQNYWRQHMKDLGKARAEMAERKRKSK